MRQTSLWPAVLVNAISNLESWAFFPGGNALLSLGVVCVYFSYAYYAAASPISNEKFIEGVVHDFYMDPKNIVDLTDEHDFDNDFSHVDGKRVQSTSAGNKGPGLFSSRDDEDDNDRRRNRSLSLKSIVVSLLRGGHYDVANHYSEMIPPPPPPPSQFFHNAQNCHQCDVNAPRSPSNLYLPSGMWERYLRATKNNQREAQQRLTDTLQWRAQEGMDDILNNPHPSFYIIKKYYPHAFHLHGYNGEPVYYECPAKINLDALKNEAGLSIDHMLRHYALVTEFMWKYVSPHENGPRSKGITVIDLEGMRLRDFAGDVISFVKQVAKFTSLYYPERSGNIFIVNPPSFFRVIWSVVQPLIDPVTLEKIRVVKSSDRDSIRNSLMERIPMENIPARYGGSSYIALGYSPEERLLKDLMDHNNNHVKGMQTSSGCYFCNSSH